MKREKLFMPHPKKHSTMNLPNNKNYPLNAETMPGPHKRKRYPALITTINNMTDLVDNETNEKIVIKRGRHRNG